MCGIAGYLGPTPSDAARLAECFAAMRHRGPDGGQSRAWIDGTGRHTQLLHTRLSIIDLDHRADQPFNVGPLWLIYNGELYNYVEIRAVLEREGVSFVTESDTEVLLSAILHWGWGALDRFEGMWAFAVYDERDRSVTFSRDRFGEKPLYLLREHGGVYFGSEIKFLSALRGRGPTVNHEHLYRYLVNGYKSLYKQDQQFFQGVSSVEAGSTLRIDAGGAETRTRYWTPRIEPRDDMSYDEAVAGTRERLIEAVRIRLRADVPLAFCMSGGVDSNALIAIARRLFDYDVHGFTIQNADARYEEQDMVEHAVAELRIRHSSVPAETDHFLDRLRVLVRQHDAPVATITYFAHWLLMEQIAGHGYRISVSGTAADELFTGYYDHHLAYLYEIRGLPALHAASVAAWTEHIKPIVRNPLLRDPDAFARNPGMRDHIYFDAAEFGGYLTRPWSEAFAETRYAEGLLRNRMLNELLHEATPVILHEDDLNAMSFSIENRSPFLDRRLFEFAGAIPTRHLVRDGCAKAVLRDAVRGIVPDRIVDSRRKVGFNAPIHAFLHADDPATRAELLRDSPVFDHVRRDRIEQLLDRAELPNSESKFLFYFLNAKMFLEEFAA